MRSPTARKLLGLAGKHTCGMLMAACKGPARRSPMCGLAWVQRCRLKPLLALAAASSACCTSASALRRCMDPGTYTQGKSEEVV